MVSQKVGWAAPAHQTVAKQRFQRYESLVGTGCPPYSAQREIDRWQTMMCRLG